MLWSHLDPLTSQQRLIHPSRSSSCRPSPASPSRNGGRSSPAGSSSSSARSSSPAPRAARPTGTCSPCRTPRRQKVLDLLRADGQGGQTGQIGTVVVHARTGKLEPSQAPAGLAARARRSCAPADSTSRTSPRRGCRSTAHTPAATKPGTGTLLSKDDTVGLGHRSSGRATRTTSRTSPACTTRSRSLRQLEHPVRVHRRRVRQPGRRAEGHPAGGLRLHRRADHPRAGVPHGRRSGACRCSARPPRSAADWRSSRC